MPICVHLTSEKNVKHIQRTGIKALSWRDFKGVYCMPVMPNYYVCHQWLRELKRGHGRGALVAVDFRLPSAEIVFVGHYSTPHARMTVSQAAQVIMSAPDPMGYEILLPRSVKRDEIHKIRSVSQVTGWRYFPQSKRRKPCDCCICRGEYGSNKLRARLRAEEPKPPTMEEIMLVLRNEKDPWTIRFFLEYKLPTKVRRNPEELEFLLAHPSEEVARGLAFVLRYYRGAGATSMLEQLSRRDDDEVRDLARESMEKIQARTSFRKLR